MKTPPNKIETLEHKLHYLKHYDYSIFVVTSDGEYVTLRDLQPDEWAKTVAHWLENNQLPVRMITVKEEKELLDQIKAENEKSNDES